MATGQAKAPAAFLSYAHLDDEASGSQITCLRQQLALGVRAALGRRFEIFQDRDGIAWGQHWPNRLDAALEQALFLIPILTPALFNSEICRGELERFLDLERRSGRSDLILPIYFITARPFEDRSDLLAATVRDRQYRDWREFWHRPIRSPGVLRAVAQLAREIEAAVHRPGPAVGGRPATATRAETGRARRRPPAVDRPTGGESTERERRTERAAAAAQPPGHPRPPSDPAPEPALQPGEVFRDIDAPWCPELVVVPAGRFLMGSPAGEEGRFDDESPHHEVVIGAPFALGRCPVKFEEYDAFCAATGRERLGDEGWGRGRQPVINVSWEDAQA